MDQQRSARYLSDITRNHLIAPLRIVVPALGYFVLYRVIYQRSGLEVIGLWSLLAAVFAYNQVADIGFSQLLARELSGARDSSEVHEVWNDIKAVSRFYLVLGATGLVIILVAGLAVLDSLPTTVGGYKTQGVWIALLLVVFTSVAMLEVRLLEAVLAALQQAVYASLTQACSLVIVFVIAVLGTFRGKPLEALALGYALGSAVQLLVLSKRARRSRPQRAGEPYTVSSATAHHRIRALVARGRGLYAANVALFLREPAFRLMVAAVVGLSAAGVVDIARRATSLIRNAVSIGATPLYPALSWSTKAGEWRHVRSLVSTWATVLVFLGAVLLGVFTAMSPSIYKLWLGGLPDEIVFATLVFSVWHIWVLFGMPFWYLLLAAGGERGAAGAIWLQLALLGAIAICGSVYKLSLATTLYLWLLTTVPTQVLVYHFVERRLGLFWSSVLRGRALYYALGSLLSYLGVAWLSRDGQPPYASLALVVILALSGGSLLWPRLRALRCVALR